MIELHFAPEDYDGAYRIMEWLKATVAEEGTDRPTFAAIANYIVTDIEEALPDWYTQLRNVNSIAKKFGYL